ncbi:MAG: copper resistance protein CopC [Actinobacteria bacterium]|nr:copper resistance protein CopC [Actinomycetota bacterium]
MAHTALVSSTPRNGATIRVTPKNFVLNFSEVLAAIDDKSINTITLIGPTKNRVKLDLIRVLESRLSAKPFAPLPIGRYEIKYRVVAEDGHALNGVIKFSIQ